VAIGKSRRSMAFIDFVPFRPVCREQARRAQYGSQNPGCCTNALSLLVDKE
jgi:hypothetical protein